MKTNNTGNQINFKAISEKNFSEKKAIKEWYKEKNKERWLIEGKSLRLERKKLGITLKKIGQLLGTSPSRISNLENGKGVLMANQLIASYKLVLELTRIKRKQTCHNAKQFGEIQMFNIERGVARVNLVLESGRVIHIQDIQDNGGLSDKYKLPSYYKVPILLGK
ncbi:helix-turn-helix domain-containing protein [Niallia taxi]|uniref:helix-turn-helix domain-containing protein n=1 Tax=Niallia taxi TaxID=2499688 RepID=UPI003F6204E5